MYECASSRSNVTRLVSLCAANLKMRSSKYNKDWQLSKWCCCNNRNVGTLRVPSLKIKMCLHISIDTGYWAFDHVKMHTNTGFFKEKTSVALFVQLKPFCNRKCGGKKTRSGDWAFFIPTQNDSHWGAMTLWCHGLINVLPWVQLHVYSSAV